MVIGESGSIVHLARAVFPIQGGLPLFPVSASMGIVRDPRSLLECRRHDGNS